jgi:hypothetical protein
MDFQVSVSTKSAKSDKQFVWEGEADTSSYTIREETDSDKLIPRGTSNTLHLKVILYWFSNLTVRIRNYVEPSRDPGLRFQGVVVSHLRKIVLLLCRMLINSNTQTRPRSKIWSRITRSSYPFQFTHGRRRYEARR